MGDIVGVVECILKRHESNLTSKRGAINYCILIESSCVPHLNLLHENDKVERTLGKLDVWW